MNLASSTAPRGIALEIRRYPSSSAPVAKGNAGLCQLVPKFSGWILAEVSCANTPPERGVYWHNKATVASGWSWGA